jgi:hypothetical protein
MDGLNKVERLQETLHQYTIREVPDDLDPWPSMQDRLARATSPQGNVKPTPWPVSMRTTLSVAGRRAQRHRGLRLSLPMLLVVIMGAATLGLAIFASLKITNPGASGGSEFVPAGKVRHIMLSTDHEGQASYNGTATVTTGTIEVWLANGPDNYLQRTSYRDYGSDNSKPQTTEVWVQDNMLYTMIPDDKVVLWQPWSFAPIYAPDPNRISDLLKEPNARIISDTIMDGRKVVVIEVPSLIGHHQEWIDKDTNRAFQWRDVDTQVGVNPTTDTAKIVVDELVDASTLAPNFFEFKLPEGYTLQERIMPTPVSTPTTIVAP